MGARCSCGVRAGRSRQGFVGRATIALPCAEHQPLTTITGVKRGSPAAAAGIVAGDRLLSIAGAPVRDYLDYRFHSADEHIEAEVLTPQGTRRTVAVEKHPDEDLGLDFADPLFDGVRLCRNRCLFCFYDQLPRGRCAACGLRASLYVRDDDFRLSFLHGNFVTLTNLADEDFTRIGEQRLSPLYVSVHATDAALRRRMLGNRRAPDILTQMRRLGRRGIVMHAQVVLCPGINDGEALSRTIADLAALHPAVASVAIVPVGLTKHRAGLPGLRAVSAPTARRLLEQMREWQRDFLSRLGSRFVFAADEIYLLAGEPFPAAAEYEGFPQRENGVGPARLFLDELKRTNFRRAAGTAVTLVTGIAARGLVEAMAARMREHGGRAHVIAIRNRLLGARITVAGLLAGKDIVGGLADCDLGDVVALPAAALRDGAFLDDMTVEELSRRLGKRVIAAAGPRELARRLAGRMGHLTGSGR